MGHVLTWLPPVACTDEVTWSAVKARAWRAWSESVTANRLSRLPLQA